MNNNEKTSTSEVRDSTAAFEEALAKKDDSKYVLRLYVAGMGPKSIQAIDNIKRIFEEYVPGKYQLEVIDIYQNPVFAKDGQIVAAPTLIKELPPPLRKLIGSMSDTDRVLVGMDLKSRKDKE
ncbi:Circadian oscillation regulator KaiB [Methanosarcina horonobensis HB-1 = JCM 15518]|uniref:Circadian oscillation regulator KaiB n=1 Tax=Methanosarcina horonobensis HB-1 = JCM 15518 TaxID=1434110 RepID=A0A0E3SAP9_9EURY|nr:circadian clock KaiB family protein [Methanosarcina horonobensis]AKB76747.1 Circadian oscillation regulator KaiB [Methanosarcina horonobensis HB-1 = JCM 15518]